MPYRPTLRQLEYIVAIDELRHFGRAASRCHVSQPTLSVQVSLVEKSLGVTLFERTSTGVLTTPIGEQIARSARLALSTVDDLVEGAVKDGNTLGGLIRLGTAPTFGPYFLPHFLPTVHRKYAELKIYIREDRPSDIEQAVLEGFLDCGLGPEPERPSLKFRRIGTELLYLGVPVEHDLAKHDTVRTRDLEGLKLLALGSGHRLLENVRHLAEVAGAEVIDDYEGTSLDSIRQMVSIGMGCSLFPELYARAEFRHSDDVKLLTITDWSERRDVGFYWRESSGRQLHFEKLAAESDAAAIELGIA